MVRYFFYILLVLFLFFLGLYFNIGWVSGFCFVGLIFLLYMGFLFCDNYREFVLRVWKIRDVWELEELYFVVVDRVRDRLFFYEKKFYLKGDSLKYVDLMKEGFVFLEIFLENELIFNVSIVKKSCIVVEEYVYENVNFKEEF